MNRLDNFLQLQNHAYYGKVFKKLTKKHIEFCLNWIHENDHLGFHQFAEKSNRLFLGEIKDLPKAEINRRNICQELISVSNKKDAK